MLTHLIKYLNLNTTKTTLELLPEGFLSMGEMADALNGLRVANVSVKIQASQLPHINFPAIAHCQTEDQAPYFVILKKHQNNEVSYFEDGKGEITETLTEFSKKWQGFTLLLAPSSQSGEPNYSENFKKERREHIEYCIMVGALLLFLFSPLLVLLTENILKEAFSWWIITVLYAVGAGISVLLLQNEYGQSSDWVQKLCGVGSKTTSQNLAGLVGNCNVVTQSAAGNILGFSWAEVGLVYFGGATLVLSINVWSLGENNHYFLASLHILTLLYVPYSLYYQAFVAKTWCTLCLLVQGINLLIAVAWLIVMPSFSEFHSYPPLFQELVGFLIVIVFWLMLKPIWKKERKLLPAQRNARRWKNDTELFLSHLHAQPAIEIKPLPCEEQIGKPDAPVLITMVSNPSCNPCQKARQFLTEWTQYFEDEMQLRIRHINTNDYQYQSHDEWANLNNIEYTPTLFINGFRLRHPYNYEDLRLHIRTIAEGGINNTISE